MYDFTTHSDNHFGILNKDIDNVKEVLKVLAKSKAYFACLNDDIEGDLEPGLLDFISSQYQNLFLLASPYERQFDNRT